MKQPLKRLFSLVLLLGGLQAAAGQPVWATPPSSPWEPFPYRSETIQLETGEPFFLLELDPSILATASPDLRDLRLYSNSEELGYARLPSPAGDSAEADTVPLTVWNEGKDEQGTYSFQLDLTGLPGKPSAIRVQLAPEPYVVKAQLFGSADKQSWQQLRQVTLTGIEGRYNELSLAGIDYPYLKLAWSGHPTEMKTAGAFAVIPSAQAETLKPDVLVPSLQIETDQVEKRTVVTADLQHPHRLTGKVTLTTKENAFYRRVVLEGSNAPQEGWERIATSYLYRSTEAGDEELSLSYSPAGYRYLRLLIYNEDNRPLRIDALHVESYPVRLLVKAPTGGASPFPVTGYWGNKQATAPSYDVAPFVHEVTPEQVVRLGQTLANPAYSLDPGAAMPFSERYPWVLPLALVVAAGAVILLLVRTMRQVQPPK